MQELISIITPMFNSERFIVSTIKSVQEQTYQNWEMIIIDDGSTDGSIKLVRTYLNNDKRIQLISLEKNQGPAKARNEGIKMACGRYISFLDSDDLWHPNKLIKQIKFMKINNYNFTFTSFAKINEQGVMLSDKLIDSPMQLSYSDLLKSDYIGCLTSIYNAGEIGKVYMPDIIKGQDYCCWLEILKKGSNAYYLKEQLAFYRVRTNSISSNKVFALMHQWHILRHVEDLPFFKCLCFITTYIYYGISKRLT